MNKKFPIKNLYQLTERENEIVKLILKGFTSFEIANKLGIKDSTVHSHKNSIYRKLKMEGISTKKELVSFFSKSSG